MAQPSEKRSEFEYCGPYGYHPQNYKIKNDDDEEFKEVIINAGWVVDSIGFVIARRDGSCYTLQVGRNTQTTKIPLKDGEYVNKISGKYGYDQDRKQIGIASIKIHTNHNSVGYGPYGEARNVDDIREFSSPTGHIVGIFGRHNHTLNTLQSIGVIMKKE